MQKIHTIFDRDWDGNRGVVDELVKEAHPLQHSPDIFVPTEKLDGTNVRLTVRKHTLVRLEKRRNPSKAEKAKGISEPWYVDVDEYGPQDKWIWEAARNTDISEVPDGEWSGEAVGPNVQGNPLNLEKNQVVLFSFEPALEKLKLENVPKPTDYQGLKDWLPTAKSVFGSDCTIEGVVWHGTSDYKGSMFKIKVKDFKS